MVKMKRIQMSDNVTPGPERPELHAGEEADVKKKKIIVCHKQLTDFFWHLEIKRFHNS